MGTVDKVVSLFNYIKELSAQRIRIITDVEKQYWRCYLKNIPVDIDNIATYYRDTVDEEADYDTTLLSVQKPEFQPCPQPPSTLSDWLTPGWGRFQNDVKVIEKINKNEVENTETEEQEFEYFNDSTQRMKAFASWGAQRNIWVEKQRDIKRTRDFFAQLFHMYSDLERDSETLELMVGDGIVREPGNNAINHPLLLKRVKFQFDAEANIVSIHDTDTEPELYTLLLKEMAQINPGAVKKANVDLVENFYHPLDRNYSTNFLKILTHNLSSKSRFIADGNYQTSDEDSLTVTVNPVFFVRKRLDGTLKTMEEIIANIQNTGHVPGHIEDLVEGGEVEVLPEPREQGIEEQLAALNGESLPILLSKEANREQLEIAERIERYNAVLVQGPPGTGKTHTIANLLGHFLAQGKNVLVTSHARKALAVLKEKVSEEIKDLCVSILDDTNLDMDRSVDGITDKMSRFTSNELKKQVEIDTRKRADIIRQLADVRKKIYAIRFREFKPIVFDGVSYSPAEAAAFVNNNAQLLAYIPGEVKLYHSLPITKGDLAQLYKYNSKLSAADDRELAYDIPSPDKLMRPEEFATDLSNTPQYTASIENIARELGIQIETDVCNKVINVNDELVVTVLLQNSSVEKLDQLSQHIRNFRTVEEWMIHAAVDGRKGGGYRERWEMLISAIEDTAEYAGAIVAQMIGRNICISGELNRPQLRPCLEVALELLQKNGRITRLNLFFNKALKAALASIRINGMEILSEEDCRLVQQYLTLDEKRQQAAFLWNELMAKPGTPEFFALGDEPERIGLQMIPLIRRYLDWYQTESTKITQLVKHGGFNTDIIFTESELDSELTHTKKTLDTIQNKLPKLIDLAHNFTALCAINERQSRVLLTLEVGGRKQSTICTSLTDAIKNNKADDYDYHYRELSELYAKYRTRARRAEMLALIDPVAPEWAQAIKSRIGIHGLETRPQDIDQAWKCKQFAAIIDSIIAEPFEELQHKAIVLGNELRRITGKVAANGAWYHLMLRTERNLDMKQALQGWKLTVKKIGKGTGKNAPALKRQARILMAKCQTAVPAWIMTVNKAMESLDPASNTFDVIIVDEASQSDISALGITYMGKKIIIVGDDKQVSPMAVGVDIDKMNALRDMYIDKSIPNWHLFDAKTSLYDITSTTFQPLMLREHFRCLPNIIGYSNKLSYDFKIKPLRGAGTSPVFPPTVNYRVADGRREHKSMVNSKEAEAIVALMMACTELEEYEGMTFGVITLLGDVQARKIQQIIVEKIEPTVIEQRRILCGNASHFQGDERDVIFLSLVDSNEEDGPLRMAGDGPDQSRKQRYNVAASRAKDQLWVVHSLDHTKDLQHGDLRRDLLEYVANPGALAQQIEEVKAKAESPFEESVATSLLAAGYHIAQQWQVGAYRIDMVVFYNDSAVAIECDGESFHSGDEQVRADMERQAILERIGWRFIRIRGSEYFRDPDKTMERVKDELNTLGIFPEATPSETLEEQQTFELLDRVKIRAAQLVDEWHKQEKEDFPVLDEIITTVSTEDILTLSEEIENQELEQVETALPSLLEDMPKIKPRTELRIRRPPKPAAKSTGSKPRLVPARDVSPNPVEQTRFMPLSVPGLIKSLKTAGIDYIDNSEQSGIIWVPLASGVKEQLEKIIVDSGFRSSYEKRGAKATNNKPAWRIMVG